jgi:D-alanine-D-alanine ligase
MARRLNVGLLFGGKSVEHEISIRSALNVFQHLNRSFFNPILIGITKEGTWHMPDSIDQPISSGPGLNLSLENSSHTFISSDNQIGTGTLDVVFPVLHGTDGEDGSIQGMLKTANIPFAGSGVLGSSVAMDKLLSKQLLINEGIPTSKYVAAIGEETELISFEQIVKEVGLPFMVKPISLGSSVGVSKVSDKKQFVQAIEETMQFDQGFLAEEFIAGRELECAILGNQKAKASDPGEIVISGNYEFYTYHAKYEDPDAVEIKIPAEIDPSLVEQIKELSLRSYKALRCEDFARVDLFLKEDHSIYINEINTIPGFTNSSMFPSLWAQHGITYSNLITKIIRLAMDRFEAKKGLNRDYLDE